jgi:hypothetical protein
MKRELIIGKKDGYQVTLEIDIKTKNSNETTIDINGNKVTEPYNTISISAYSKHWAGQCIEMVESMDECYLIEGQLPKLIEIWKQWHLNDMKPYCIHQLKNWDLNKEIIINSLIINSWKVKNKEISKLLEILKYSKDLYEFNKLLKILNSYNNYLFVEMLRDIKKNILNNEQYIPKNESEKSWFDNEIIQYQTKKEKANRIFYTTNNEGLLNKPCEICDYQYGSKWLIEIVPQDIIQFINNELNTTKLFIINEIDQWMMDNDIKTTLIKLVENNEYMSIEMDHWEYTFQYGKHFKTFKYSIGYGHRINFKKHSNSGIPGIEEKRKLNEYLKSMKKQGIEFNLNMLNNFNFDDNHIMGIPTPAQPKDVIDCIMEEIAMYNNYDDYVHMAKELGYSLDTKEERIKAKKVYIAMEENKNKMEALIGENLINDYIKKFLIN